ncbi:MAG: hypothetical protein CVV05_09985 [Gammaproteobacteria bacterium HGW-Gammaproteobacteria-1]|nr:MAG: hypothetical protein CVV05_09985 [Gammaproteobacteria bacterium HGW-Gammaproteobacteria-1]
MWRSLWFNTLPVQLRADQQVWVTAASLPFVVLSIGGDMVVASGSLDWLLVAHAGSTSALIRTIMISLFIALLL